MVLIPNKPFTGPPACIKVLSSAENISGAVISILSSVFKITFFEKTKLFFPLLSIAVSDDKNNLEPFPKKTLKIADFISAVSFFSVEII